VSDTSFLGLVQNAALLLAVAFIFDVAATRWRTGQSSFRQASVGLALGAIGIIIMLTPWTFTPGIVFDTRSVLIGISGLFFGSVSTAIVMTLTAGFRYYLGGAGAWTGVGVIIASGVIGIAWRHFRRRPLAEISWRELYLFGIVIHLTMLAMMLTLPWETALRVLSNIALPVLVIYPPGTALLGTLMVNRLRRERAEDENRELLAAVQEEKTRLSSLIDSMTDEVWFADTQKRFTMANPSALKQFCIDTDQIVEVERLAKSLVVLRPDGSVRPVEEAPPLRALLGEVVMNQEELIQIPASGEFRYRQVNAAPVRDAAGSIMGSVSVVRDITEKKQAEEALCKSEAKYRGILENMDDAYYELDLNGNLVFFNDALISISGYSREELMGMNYRQYISHETYKPVQRVFSEIYKTCQPVRLFDYEIIMKGGQTRNFESWANLLFDNNNQPIGFKGMARDITKRKRAEKALKETLDSLRKAVGTTIQVMVSAVETRDPYTAGHQFRSADLAIAIATEMGLPQEKIEAIRMAGPIHDIGKLSIPAEILSKPTKLSEIEFSLIKEHSWSGYEILKDVESPWPLAEIVYQHHERMNGSGYPRNLKGEEIIMEARIMAVADVVEAMASHRPYRPALGIDVALEELEKNRGTFYDNAVADACLRLFREKDYQIEST
jgi:PAS domain S-box-containing protein